MNFSESQKELVRAVRDNGDLNIVKKHALIEENKTFMKERGANLMFIATAKGYFPIVKFFIKECGVDPKSTGQRGGIALHHAASEGRLNIFRYFVEEHDLDINFADSLDGWTPLHIAVQRDHISVVKYLLDLSSESLDNGKEKSVDVNFQDSEGFSSLHLASYLGLLDMVKYLIEKADADISIKNKDGMTALDVAVEEQEAEVSLYLKSLQKS